MKKLSAAVIGLLAMQFFAASPVSVPAFSCDFSGGDVSGIKGKGITSGCGSCRQIPGIKLPADKFTPVSGSCSF